MLLSRLSSSIFVGVCSGDVAGIGTHDVIGVGSVGVSLPKLWPASFHRQVLEGNLVAHDSSEYGAREDRGGR